MARRTQNLYTRNNRPTIVTSALPYANGEIHLGHIASTYLPADIFTRYCRLAGREIYHVCASDDFGTPILINSEKEEKTPQSYVDFWHRRDLDDFESVGISFDVFSNTSSRENIEFVQDIFKKLFHNGHIYEQDVIQYYCTWDNKFLPDRYVVGQCPYCKAQNQYSDQCEKCGRVPEHILEPKCAICGRPPIQRSSKHYFFKLSAFSERLKKWLNENHKLQRDVKNYVINWIDEGLHDWDITRDLSWGVSIPLPNIQNKVLYGWFDNHLCYISTLLTYMHKLGHDGKKVWNNSEIYHFIGKDISYHHYLFLPAMRMGINQEYKLPDFIPTRGHLLLNNQKLSKSRNWYISLKKIIDMFNPDYLRFYLASVTPYSQADINFEWATFCDKINNELIANVGNFINRTLSFIQTAFAGIVPEPLQYDDDDRQSIMEIKKISNEVGDLLIENEVDKALKRILKFTSHFNQYFQKKEPWKNTSSTASTTIYIAVNATKSLAIILEPFIPFSSEKIWSQLGSGGNIHEQSWSSASEINIQPGQTIGKIERLFLKIDPGFIKQHTE